jgi:hypothetical protein
MGQGFSCTKPSAGDEELFRRQAAQIDFGRRKKRKKAAVEVVAVATSMARKTWAINAGLTVAELIPKLFRARIVEVTMIATKVGVRPIYLVHYFYDGLEEKNVSRHLVLGYTGDVLIDVNTYVFGPGDEVIVFWHVGEEDVVSDHTVNGAIEGNWHVTSDGEEVNSSVPDEDADDDADDADDDDDDYVDDAEDDAADDDDYVEEGNGDYVNEVNSSVSEEDADDDADVEDVNDDDADEDCVDSLVNSSANWQDAPVWTQQGSRGPLGPSLRQTFAAANKGGLNSLRAVVHEIPDGPFGGLRLASYVPIGQASQYRKHFFTAESQAELRNTKKWVSAASLRKKNGSAEAGNIAAKEYETVMCRVCKIKPGDVTGQGIRYYLHHFDQDGLTDVHTRQKEDNGRGGRSTARGDGVAAAELANGDAQILCKLCHVNKTMTVLPRVYHTGMVY